MKKIENIVGNLIQRNFVPTQDVISRVEKFCTHIQTGYYEKRNQYDPHIREKQNFAGKMAECAVSKYLKSREIVVKNDVDFKIYPAEEKKFDSDLVVSYGEKDYKLSVKCSLMERGGRTERLNGEPILEYIEPQHSYVVNLANVDSKGGRDNGKYDIYFFCNLLNAVTYEIEIYAWVWAKYIPNMLILPFKQELKKAKGCIMQKSCSCLEEYPCGVEEFIKRNTLRENVIENNI